jgi:carboxymethylenebutenolidase
MRITLPSGTPAELGRPDGSPQLGLVIAPDIFGLRPLYDDLVARLAREWDMVVIAPEPFPGRDLGPDVEPRFAAVNQLEDMDHLRDLHEAADETGCDGVGLVGFCMGGMYALKAAGLRRFDRIVSFYGMIRTPEAWRSPGHEEPLHYLARPGASPVLAIIGERDHYTPPADVEALEALRNVTVVRYPEAEHGFVHDPSRPAHRPDDAQDAWDRCYHFLRT